MVRWRKRSASGPRSSTGQRCHHRQDHRRPHHRVESRGRAHVRLFRRGDHRPHRQRALSLRSHQGGRRRRGAGQPGRNACSRSRPSACARTAPAAGGLHRHYSAAEQDGPDHRRVENPARRHRVQPGQAPDRGAEGAARQDPGRHSHLRARGPHPLLEQGRRAHLRLVRHGSRGPLCRGVHPLRHPQIPRRQQAGHGRRRVDRRDASPQPRAPRVDHRKPLVAGPRQGGPGQVVPRHQHRRDREAAHRGAVYARAADGKPRHPRRRHRARSQQHSHPHHALDRRAQEHDRRFAPEIDPRDDRAECAGAVRISSSRCSPSPAAWKASASSSSRSTCSRTSSTSSTTLSPRTSASNSPCRTKRGRSWATRHRCSKSCSISASTPAMPCPTAARSRSRPRIAWPTSTTSP